MKARLVLAARADEIFWCFVCLLLAEARFDLSEAFADFLPAAFFLAEVELDFAGDFFAAELFVAAVFEAFVAGADFERDVCAAIAAELRKENARNRERNCLFIADSC